MTIGRAPLKDEPGLHPVDHKKACVLNGPTHRVENKTNLHTTVPICTEAEGEKAEGCLLAIRGMPINCDAEAGSFAIGASGDSHSEASNASINGGAKTETFCIPLGHHDAHADPAFLIA